MYTEHLTVRTHAHIVLESTSCVTSGSWARRLCVFEQNHSIPNLASFGCSVSFVSSDFLFTHLFSGATFRIIYTAAWNQKIPLCHSAVGWNVLASGQSNPAPDTGYEPKFCIDVSNEHTPINLYDSNRNFPPPLRTLMYLGIPELEAAPSIQQQQGEFPPCRNKVQQEIASRKCWRIMILLTVVIASGNPVQT